MYESSTGDVRPRGFDAESAADYYRDYIDFVSRFASPGRLLDVGCGNGWSSFLFSHHGFEAVGIDVDASAFEPPESPSLSLHTGSAAALPYDDAAFDVVAYYQALEHMPEPAAVLAEGCRVLRPRGSIFIVGPNLMGLSPSLAALSVHVWRNRPLRRVLVRDAAMPRHPYGNTLPEVVWTMVTNGFRLGGKLLSPEANPTMRTPDTTPPFFADNDASFVCNPVDVKRMLRREGVRVIRDGKPGRPGFLSMMSGGTWIAGRKDLGEESFGRGPRHTSKSPG